TVSPLALAQTDPDAAYIPPPPPGLVKRLQQEGQTSAHDSTRIIPRVAPEMTPEPYSPAEVPPPPLARPSMDAAPAVVPEVVSNEPYVPAMMERMNAEASAVTPSGDFQRLEDVLRASYIDNPTLRAARSEMKATHERLPQAQAGWKPTLAGEAAVTWADIDQSPAAVVGGGDGTTSTQVGLSATQPLYRGGRTVAAVDGAENLINAQRAILNATEQRIMRDVATAYMDVVRDQAVLELRTNNKAVIERQLEATSDRFEVGELTRTDVSQAEARLAGAEADRTRAVGNLRTSRSIYRQLTGMEAGALGYPQLAFNIPPTLDSAMKVAEADNPAVVASRFRHKASQSDIKGIFGELLPLVQLFASWDKEYDPQPGILDEVTTSAIGVNATVPFYSGGATRSRVREAKYIANQRMITIQETVRQAVQEAVANWESLAAAKAEITSREAQVAAAAIAREGVYQEAELGSRTILDTLDADQEYLDAQVALVTARRNETVATFFLASTLGLLTPKTLGFSEIAADHDAHLKYTTGKILGMDVDIVEEGR
ncbi:MAG: TolC family outer membrane protein, partial [Alphaproteobacteria bacterium]|nr:TolC family outer membrane protein [Alphaproteobacteria bacterium]